jgi:hypothetical protein
MFVVLPLQIQNWFGPQSDMILCCVVRSLLPLADHLLLEVWSWDPVSPSCGSSRPTAGHERGVLSVELRERR